MDGQMHRQHSLSLGSCRSQKLILYGTGNEKYPQYTYINYLLQPFQFCSQFPVTFLEMLC